MVGNGFDPRPAQVQPLELNDCWHESEIFELRMFHISSQVKSNNKVTRNQELQLFKEKKTKCLFPAALIVALNAVCAIFYSIAYKFRSTNLTGKHVSFMWA